MYNKLNIPIKFNNISELCYETYEGVTPFPIKDIEKYVSVETLDMFKKSGLQIKNAIIFTYPPNSDCKIHVDGDVTQFVGREIGCLNVVVTKSEDWYIEWFKLSGWSEPDIRTRVVNEIDNDSYDSIKRSVTYYYQPTGEVFERTTFMSPTLIRIDIPHRVVNTGNDWRHCISFRFTDQDYNTILNKLQGTQHV